MERAGAGFPPALDSYVFPGDNFAGFLFDNRSDVSYNQAAAALVGLII
jgi:hypothetical protein